MVTDTTSHIRGLKTLLLRSTSIAEHTKSQTWQSWPLSVLEAVTHVYVKWLKAGRSEPWVLHSLWEWISVFMVCKPSPSLIPLNAHVPLPSWSRPSHPRKLIKILILYLYFECMNDRYECKHLNVCTNTWSCACLKKTRMGRNVARSWPVLVWSFN